MPSVAWCWQVRHKSPTNCLPGCGHDPRSAPNLEKHGSSKMQTFGWLEMPHFLNRISRCIPSEIDRHDLPILFLVVQKGLAAQSDNPFFLRQDSAGRMRTFHLAPAYDNTKRIDEVFMPDIRYAQNENVDRGDLRMQVIERGTSTPIDDAKISISYSGDPDSTVEEVNTDASGMSETLTLDTPPLELSMQPSEVQPYAEYTIQVTAKGYRPINISGIEVFSGQLSLQEIRMDAEETTESMTDNIVIPAHTLFAEYPPKIAEAEIKPVTETGEIILSRVVIPEYVIVHDGAPSDPTARDYYVRYRDYIKNVASSEIYSTWPDTTIRANVLAIMSFTLNRVYTEW